MKTVNDIESYVNDEESKRILAQYDRLKRHGWGSITIRVSAHKIKRIELTTTE